jgi:phosphocarrier protein HPr
MFEECKIQITNRLGLHVRPAAQLSEIANKYHSKITITQSNISVNAKSIIELLTLGAGQGTLLTIKAEGDDASNAVSELKQLITNKFNEE